MRTLTRFLLVAVLALAGATACKNAGNGDNTTPNQGSSPTGPAGPVTPSQSPPPSVGG